MPQTQRKRGTGPRGKICIERIMFIHARKERSKNL